MRTVGHYVQRRGFTPQKPLTRAYEQRPEAVAHWLAHEHPQIKERA